MLTSLPGFLLQRRSQDEPGSLETAIPVAKRKQEKKQHQSVSGAADQQAFL